MNAVRREAEEDTQVTNSPNQVTKASVHSASKTAVGSRGSKGDMMLLPKHASNQKIVVLPRKNAKKRIQKHGKLRIGKPFGFGQRRRQIDERTPAIS